MLSISIAEVSHLLPSRGVAALMRIALLTGLLSFFATAQADEAAEVAESIRDKIYELEPPIPNITPLFDYHLRDVTITKGPNRKYYLTGTTDDNWGVNEGIRVWESSNLKDWKLLGEDGFVWMFDRDGTEAQRKTIVKNGILRRGAWAPEIHYIKGNFYIPFFIAGNDVGGVMIKSKTGKAEGPYEIVARDVNFGTEIDQTLFVDPKDDTIYNIWGPGRVKRMLPDMSDLMDKEATFLKDAKGNKVGYEGVNLFEKNGIYYLMAAEWNGEGPERGHRHRNTPLIRRAADGRYDAMIAMSKGAMGPYGESYLAIPHAGHNMIFEDFDGNLWSTMFGNDEAGAPFREDPGLVPLYIAEDGKIWPKHPHPVAPPADAPVLYVSQKGDNSDGKSWKTAFNSINAAIQAAQEGTQIWVADGTYNEPLKIDNKDALWLFGGFKGREDDRSKRKVVDAGVIIDVTGQNTRAGSIIDSEYVSIDGFTFMGGRIEDRYDNGGGLLIRGGGEHVVITNSVFKDNYSAGDGGGVYITDGASPLFIQSRFENNLAINNGGAVAINANDYNGYHTRFYNSVIDKNEARVDGGAVHIWTKHMRTGTLRIVNSVISNNKTVLNCGNVCMRGGSVLLMVNSVAYKNKGMSNAVAFATLGNIPAQHRIINNVFVGNRGGTVFRSPGFSKTKSSYLDIPGLNKKKVAWTNFLNNAFYDNQTLALTERAFDLERRNSAEEINQIIGSADNIDADPMFVNPEKGDFRLKRKSPLRGVGSQESGFPLDMNGEKRDIYVLPVEDSDISLGVY